MNLIGSAAPSGGTVINGGTLITRNSLGSGPITVNNGGTLSAEGNHNTLSGSAPTAASILTINAGGVVTGTFFAAHLGPVVLNGGTLSGTDGSGFAKWIFDHDVSTLGATTATTSTINANSIALQKSGGVTFTVAGTDTVNISSSFLNNAASNKLIKAGSGTLNITGANALSGGTDINAGLLAVSASGKLGTGTVTLNGGTLSIAAGSTPGGGAYTVNASGILANAGAISSAVSVAGSGLVQGTGSFTGNVTVATDGVLQAGASTSTTGVLSFTTGTVTLADKAVLRIALGATGTSHTSFTINNLTLNGDVNFLFDDLDVVNGTTFTGLITGLATAPDVSKFKIVNQDWLGTFSFNAGAVDFFYIIPEPSSYGLLGAGVLAFAGMIRRRRKTVS